MAQLWTCSWPLVLSWPMSFTEFVTDYSRPRVLDCEASAVGKCCYPFSVAVKKEEMRVWTQGHWMARMLLMVELL